MVSAGCRLSVVGLLLVVGCGLWVVVGCWLWVVGCCLVVVSLLVCRWVGGSVCRCVGLTAVTHHLSLVSCQLFAVCS